MPPALLSPEQCLFCLQKTDVKITCTHCSFHSFATCKHCKALGAPSIRQPRRMTLVLSKLKGKKAMKRRYMCYPMCARECAYRCRRCERWFDKTLLHAFSRQEKNIQYGLCELCAAREKLTICSSCHGVCGRRDEYRDSQGYKCRDCFSRKNQFKRKDVAYRINTKSKNTQRTFGLELEINNVHRGNELSEAVAAINVNGVEFNVKSDGSIYYGFEIVSHPAEKCLLLPALKGLCEVVRTFKHNHENAGLHVHVRDKNPLEFYKIWLSVEPLIFRFLPHFRRSSSYGRPRNDVTLKNLLDVKTIEQAIQIQEDRYMACNLYNVNNSRKTVELRCHHATSNYSSMYHWVQLIDAICERAKDLSADDVTVFFNLAHKEITDASAQAILSSLRLPAKTLRFYLKRKKFYDTHMRELPDDEMMTRFEGDNERDPRLLNLALQTSRRRGNDRFLDYARALRRSQRHGDEASLPQAIRRLRWSSPSLAADLSEAPTHPFPPGTYFSIPQGTCIDGCLCPVDVSVNCVGVLGNAFIMGVGSIPTMGSQTILRSPIYFTAENIENARGISRNAFSASEIQAGFDRLLLHVEAHDRITVANGTTVPYERMVRDQVLQSPLSPTSSPSN